MPIANDEGCGRVDPDRGITIKREAELRHVLSHVINAIEHLAEGAPESALHELESITGLVFWETSAEMRGYLDGEATEEEVHDEAEAADEDEQRPTPALTTREAVAACSCDLVRCETCGKQYALARCPVCGGGDAF